MPFAYELDGGPLSAATLQPHPDYMDACTVVGSLGVLKAIVFMHPSHLMVPTRFGGKAFCLQILTQYLCQILSQVLWIECLHSKFT